MLKAAVFDDEYIVLQGLQTMIDWSRYGIELVGAAGDGISALALFQAEKPDIILTDIRMPGMDGLQLVEAVLREAPETYCIVFSGFNEFEYVRRAIQLGVSDYLDKPITIESIEYAIQKMTTRIHAQKETAELREKWENGKRAVLGKAVSDLLLIGPDAKTGWSETFGPQSQHVVGVTVFACSDEFTFDEQPEYVAVSVQNGQERLAIIFHLLPPSNEFWEQLAQESEQVDIVIGGGRTYPDAGQASLSYKEALRAFRSALFLNMKGTVRFDELGEILVMPDDLSEWEEAMILSMRAGDYKGLIERIDRFIEWIQSAKVDPEAAERQMIKLIYLAQEVSKEAGLLKLEEDSLPHVEIREMMARGKALQWFREQMERIARSSLENRERTKHTSIEQARIFIEQNLSRDLSLEAVAGHVGMNPSYLSVLFKEVLGETYIKYVTRCRMELAKKLLLKGFKVNQVSEQVGYHTYRHFSDVFKKYTGCTPGQYPKKSDANP
jgi:two-component system response regulator YesN